MEFILSFINKLFSYYRSHKQPHIGTNFRSEIETADGKHTQTESMISNDAAVNTGRFYFLSLKTPKILLILDLYNTHRCFPAKLAKMTMIDEISLKEFTSGSIDIVKIVLIVVQFVKLSCIEGEKEDLYYFI